MRIDSRTCRDPDLLAAEVQRLQAVIDAEPPTLTHAERDAVKRAADALSGVEDYSPDETEKDRQALATLRGLLTRMGGE